MARMTGVDDGEEETVLDLSVKPGMNQGWIVIPIWLPVRKTVIAER